MERPACVNVSAEDCAVACKNGRSFIRYLGEEYYVIGLYFARGLSRRELHYVLVQDPLESHQRTN